MRNSHFFSILALSAGVIGSVAIHSPAFAQSKASFDSYAQSDLSTAQVEVIVMAAGYDNIGKIERERDAFEVKASDKNGAKAKLYVDPKTGGITRKGRKESSTDRRADDLAAGS